MIRLDQDTLSFFFPFVEKKIYNTRIDGKKNFNQPAENDLKTYVNILKVATNQ